jgi:Tol biopolymer transport system component
MEIGIHVRLGGRIRGVPTSRWAAVGCAGAALLLVMLTACGGDATAPEPALPRPEILFSSTIDGPGLNLYAVTSDGMHTIQITSGPGMILSSRWSPDGRRIVFTRDMVMRSPDGRDRGVDQLFVIDEDGSNERRLTEIAMSDRDPSWSPDGRRILFTRESWSFDWGLYLINPDGTGLVRLTGGGWRIGNPRWSPDGQRIAFLKEVGPPSFGSGPQAIHIMDATGGNIVQIGPIGVPIGPGLLEMLSSFEWFPDGNRILLRTASSPLLILNVGDGSIMPATGFPADMEGMPVWSPDGRRIAFRSSLEHPQGGADAFVANVDGSARVNLTRHQGRLGRVMSWRRIE